MPGLSLETPLFYGPERPPIRFPVVDDVHENAGGVRVIGRFALEDQDRARHALGLAEHFHPVLAVVDHLGHRGDVEGFFRDLLDIGFERDFTFAGIDDVRSHILAFEMLAELVGDYGVAQADLDDLGPLRDPALVGRLHELGPIDDAPLHQAIILKLS